MHEQILADVNVTLHEVVESSVVYFAGRKLKKLTGKTLAQRKCSAPTVVMFPSESMWVCFLSELSVVDLSSVVQCKAM